VDCRYQTNKKGMVEMRRVRNRDAAYSIAAFETFKNSTGSFSGGWEFKGTGILPTEYQSQAYAARYGYFVYSYDTPIAWYVNGEGWTEPDTKYSVTTTKHQGITRQGMRESKAARCKL
jgi:hypothetical protein